MATSRDPSTADPGPVELKGRMSTLTVLRLLAEDMDRVLAGIDERIAEAPAMFTGMPVAIDGSALPAWPDSAALRALVAGLSGRGLMPVALTGDAEATLACELGLGVLPENGAPASRERPATASEAIASENNVARASRVVSQQVRSGQQVYARGGDLVVAASVSPGAEVLADGHVHVYGSLKGRAMAGVQGDTEACIFARRFNAELVAVAGRYQVSDNFSEEERGGEARIRLHDEVLSVEPLPGTG